jgi:hypothetical protein
MPTMVNTLAKCAERPKAHTGHLQLAHHDAQNRLQHFFFADGGMHLARGLKQRLEPRYLLL